MADISEVTVIKKNEDGTIVTTTTYDIKDEIAREQLNAIPDGTYPDMTVGGVMSSDGSTDSTPYLYRVSGGGVEVGTVEEDSIVGGTVAFNQLVQNGNFESDTLWTNESETTHSIANGILTLTTGTKNNGIRQNGFACVTGHKYVICAESKCDEAKLIAIGSSVTFGVYTIKNIGSAWTAISAVVACKVSSDNTPIYIYGRNTTLTNAQVRNFCIFDLTQMFGSTIADYIYSLEQSSTGAGVSFFRKLFPNDYYAYNAGELMHVSGVSEHVMRGKNLNPNEGVNYTINNSQRFFMKAGNYVFSTDNGAVITAKNAVYIQLQNEDGTVITKGGITSTNMQLNGTETCYFGGQFNSECAFTLNYDAYMLIGFNNQKPTNFNALQIELGARATAYEPYREPYHYPLDSSLTLRGIPKVADGKLYFDGDTYEADGTVTRKYGIVDMGTLNWSLQVNTEHTYGSVIPNMMPATSNLICDKYEARPSGANNKYDTENLVVFAHNDTANPRIRVVNQNVTSGTELKTVLSGVMLVYELATPTTESAEPYDSIQKVSKYGTEEYVSTSIVPVGHVTKYPTDIVAKVNGLPSDFSTLIAPTEKEFKASRAYSVNQFIIVDNQLYRVTSAIASGATITVGTNVVATTIADILTSLLNA